MDQVRARKLGLMQRSLWGLSGAEGEFIQRIRRGHKGNLFFDDSRSVRPDYLLFLAKPIQVQRANPQAR